MTDKWYSNDLNKDKVKDLTKRFAKICKATGTYGINNQDESGLRLVLNFEDGCAASWRLLDWNDIRELLVRTNADDNISKLSGKIIETYHLESGGMNSILKGISINEYLI